MESQETPKKSRHFLSDIGLRVMLLSIIAGVLICAVLFTLMGVNITTNSNRAIDDIGATYMENMGYQIAQRFEAVMNQRISMLEGIIRDYEDMVDDPNIKDDLKMSAQSRDFEFLAYYRVDDLADQEHGSKIEMLLGTDLEVTDKLPFRTSVLDGEAKIAVGFGKTPDGQGNEINHDNIIIISAPTEKFKMSDGKNCQALVAGITNSDFVSMLHFNKEDDQNSGAYIVRRDVQGNESNSFVLKQTGDNDYQFLSQLLRDKLSAADIDQNMLSAELNEIMQNDEVYSTIMHIEGHHVHMYCTKLVHSEWYLVTLVNNDNLNSIIEDLGTRWTIMIIVSILSIIVILVIIFLLFLHFNKKSIQELQEARVEALNASKAKSEFLSNMSHDIRTPMNAIVGMTAIATTNIDNKQQVQNCLKKIALSSKHLLGLINDILDMSKIESGKMSLNVEQISLSEVLDGITTITQPQIKVKNQNFSVIVGNVIQENVYCDSVRLNQVLLNLLSNAIKFTSDGGSIEVYLDQTPSPLGDDFVRTRIRVKDNGIGMSPEFQKKIFESFTREDSQRVHRTEGTGLGMSITKYIVDAMKGTITLQSELGKGTEFTVVLDMEKATLPEEDMILPNWKMLLVDDDLQLCETTTETLKEIGIDADWTLDGETAVEKTVEAYDSHRDYDIILLDWKLPGINGVETARRIKKRLNGDHIPILLMSAYDWSDIEEEARAAGICGFLSKPLFKSTLFHGLKQFAGDAAGSEEAATASKKTDLAGINVLLAEDNDLNWEIAEALLEDVGIHCDHAENGKICVEMFENSAPGTYQAILMDIRMPVMNGYEATVEIRKSNHPDKDLPVIAMTADAFSDDRKKCLECGMNAHIAKPIDIDVVQSTLAKFLNK